MKQSYLEWRPDFDSKSSDSPQNSNSLKILQCQTSLMELFEKDFPHHAKNTQRPYEAFREFETLIYTTTVKLVEKSKPGFMKSLFGIASDDFKIDPKSRAYKNFLQQANTIFPTPPCETLITLYISKNNDALGVTLPSSDKINFVSGELQLNHCFSAEEQKHLQSASPDIFNKGNKKAKVISLYKDNPSTLFITGYQKNQQLYVFCQTEQNRHLILNYFQLKLTEVTLLSQPVIGFSMMVSLFTQDSHGRYNLQRVNEADLCSKRIAYYGLFVTFLPKEAAKTVVEYAHDCALSS